MAASCASVGYGFENSLALFCTWQPSQAFPPPPFFSCIFNSSSSSPAVLFLLLLVLSLTRRKLLFRETEMGKRVRASDSGVRALALCVCRVCRESPGRRFLLLPHSSLQTHTLLFLSLNSRKCFTGPNGKRTLKGVLFLLFDCKQIPQSWKNSKSRNKTLFLFERCRFNTFRPSEFLLSRQKLNY